MKINPLILITIILVISILTPILYKNLNQSPTEHCLTIGILQSTSHPALDKAREGFIKTVEESMGNNVKFIIKNAQGSIANMQTIAQSMHMNQDIDAIYAIATPAAQAIATIEKEKPIIIAAVTDHTTIIYNNQQNICGGSDKINIPATIEALKLLLPNIKKIALLTQIGGEHYEQEIKEFENEIQKQNLESIRIGFSSEADVAPAIIAACGKSDMILTPNYNIIASAMPTAASIALKNNKPIMACYPDAVKQGAFAAYGIDYFTNGIHAGECAIELFKNGKKPFELPIKKQIGSLVINEDVAQKLNIAHNSLQK
jgi:putative tryptophan/tyrosine transport system substrate-binding protein